jgi:hypothetical protein
MLYNGHDMYFIGHLKIKFGSAVERKFEWYCLGQVTESEVTGAAIRKTSRNAPVRNEL